MKFTLVFLALGFLPALCISVNACLASGRVPWTTSRVVGSPDPPKPYRVQRVYPKLRFDQPVELMPLPGSDRMMLLEVTGKLYTFDDDPECSQADLAIDLQPLADEFRRAYGFGIHPEFESNRQIFLAYASDRVGQPDGTRLSRFLVSEDSPPVVDPDSEEVLLTWASGGHNGCAIRFDSQGLLYFSAGDGARPFPPDEYDVSQDLSDLRSTICRIDVDHPEGDRPYSIPADNPFVSHAGEGGVRARPEIWAYGFRNPWRFTIAPKTDQLLCGDVGWELWELVFDVKRGGNYGWSLFEGPQPIRADVKPGPTPISKPLIAYPHTVGQSVTGGLVYQGQRHPELQGAYLYGDYVTGLLWGMRQQDEEVVWNPVLSETGLQIITFASARNGELLLVDFAGGIYELVKNDLADQTQEFPRKLSETGLFKATPSLKPAAGVIPYQLAATAWQDGAKSEFLLAIPDTGTIEINQRQRAWKYPVGTVFAKTLTKSMEVAGQTKDIRLETQILHFNGIDWQPYSYLWNDTQTDADLVDAAGAAKQFPQGPSWQVQNRAQCRACHSRQHGGAVGFTFANLQRPSLSDPSIDQVDRFLAEKVLNRPAPKHWKITGMVDPADPNAALSARARSYLTANCAHCHSRGGGGTVPLDLLYANSTDKINAINVAPLQGSFGIDDAKVILPGDPSRSVLFYRMASGGTGHMPKSWGYDNDVPGLRLIHDWIASMEPAAGDRDSRNRELEEIVQDTSLSLDLFAGLLSGQSSYDAAAVASAASDKGNAVTAAIFERFLPADQRRKRLGDNIDREKILAIQSDASRGRELFVSGRVGQCVNCHRLHGSGRSVGPDLDIVAKKKTRAQLLESILNPSKDIDAKYRSHSVLTADGAVVTGLKMSETDQAIVIRQADGKDVTISQESIESFKLQPQSIMPSGLAADMTAQELADLVAFLWSLKQE